MDRRGKEKWGRRSRQREGKEKEFEEDDTDK